MIEGAVDESVDGLSLLDCVGLGTDEATALAESTELPDCGDVGGGLPLDGMPALEVSLSEPCDAEPADKLDPTDDVVLSPGDDCSDSISALVELTTDGSDASDGVLGEVTELPDLTALLPPLLESNELLGDGPPLAWLPLLVSLGNSDDVPLASDEVTPELNPLDGVSLAADEATELANDGCDEVVLDAPPELDPSPLPDDCGLNDDGWLSPLDA